MPELPDVELFKHRLDAKTLHRTIADVVVTDRRILDRLFGSDLYGSAHAMSTLHIHQRDAPTAPASRGRHTIA